MKSKEYRSQLVEPELSVQSSAKRSVKKGKKAAQRPVEECDTSDHILTCVDSCWAKLRKYYSLMDQSPVYAAAVVLNPEHKCDYFRTNWTEHPEWIARAEESVRDFWQTTYKNSTHISEAEVEHAKDSGLFLPTPKKEPTKFDQWISRTKYNCAGMREIQDEYDAYLEAEFFLDQGPEALKSVNLCAFWACYEARYPSLARMAFDVLSIPAMSAECERTFSSAKLLITDRRARLKEDIIEASECLRAWF